MRHAEGHDWIQPLSFTSRTACDAPAQVRAAQAERSGARPPRRPRRLPRSARLARVVRGVRPALGRLTALYGSTPACEFSPSSIRALQRKAVVEEGLSRQYVNGKLLPVIKRAFRWGVREGLVPADVLPRISACEPVAYGEYGARETEPVRPVDPELLDRTLAELSPIIADMARVQLLTGMRPGELCAMRWDDIETSSSCWVYRPVKHKNSHRGKPRAIPIGPKGQKVLMRYRRRPVDQPVFLPREADTERRERLRSGRRTP